MPDLPTEVWLEVLRHADLETVVLLGQTDKTLRQMCHTFDTVIEAKLRKRVPWIQPGNDGIEPRTWYDCARFVCERTKLIYTHPLSSLQRNLFEDIGNYEATDIEPFAVESSEYLCDTAKVDISEDDMPYSDWVGPISVTLASREGPLLPEDVQALFGDGLLEVQVAIMERREPNVGILRLKESTVDLKTLKCASKAEKKRNGGLDYGIDICERFGFGPPFHTFFSNTWAIDNGNEVLFAGSLGSYTSLSYRRRTRYALVRRVDGELDFDNAYEFNTNHCSAGVDQVPGAMFISFYTDNKVAMCYISHEKRALFEVFQMKCDMTQVETMDTPPPFAPQVVTYDGLLWVSVNECLVPLHVDLEHLDGEGEPLQKDHVDTPHIHSPFVDIKPSRIVPGYNSEYSLVQEEGPLRRLVSSDNDSSFVDLSTSTVYSAADADSKHIVRGMSGNKVGFWSISNDRREDIIRQCSEQDDISSDPTKWTIT